MAYDNEMRGVLFQNDRKREGKKDADHRGHLQIAGVKYWVDAWENEKDGKRYLSLKLKEDGATAAPTPAAGKPAGKALDDEVPW